MKPYLEAGEFTTTHGIGGELRLYPYADDPGFLTGFSTLYLDDAGKRPLAVVQIRPHKSICVVKLAGVDSIDDARPYIGKTAYLARADAKLPEGRYFVQDLLGARVVDADSGEVYGTIHAITRPGRHDVYEVARPDGSSVLFPAVDSFIAGTDLAAGEIRVRPISGMFDGDEAAVKDEDTPKSGGGKP